jgi:hypothetical protein
MTTDKRGMTVWVGFGADLPEGTSIAAAWGTLRTRRDSDAGLFQAHGATFDVGRGCVLEVRVDDPWVELPDGRPALEVPSIEDPRWKRVALGLLLAQEPTEARPALPWCCVGELDGGGGGSSFRQFIKGGWVLDEKLPEVERWLSLVNDSRLPDIAVDRATTMVSRLVDHVDALIDGVIVWECLFGTGDTNELSYRISMNMACVLTDNPTERLEYRSEIKKLYTLRSRAVHGGVQLRSGEDTSHRSRVQELTLTAMRSLLDKHPRLIGARPQDFVAFVLGAEPG